MTQNECLALHMDHLKTNAENVEEWKKWQIIKFHILKSVTNVANITMFSGWQFKTSPKVLSYNKNKKLPTKNRFKTYARTGNKNVK